MIGQLVLNSFVLGAVIALMAVGFTLIFGILRVVNYAHGEAYMVGAVIVFYLSVTLGLSYYLSLFISVIAVGIMGWTVDKVIFRRLRGNLIGGAIAALALLMGIQNTMWYIFGPFPQSIPSVVTGTVSIAGAIVSSERLLITGISFAVIVFMVWFVKYTKLGKSMRAVQQDSEAALTLGIDVDRVSGITFGMATGLAALAGGLVAPLFSVQPAMGGGPLLLSLVVVILGGMGSVIGAIIASFIIGFQQSFTGAFIGAEFALMISAVIALVVLVFRPRGLAGYE